eukprot:7749663-Lingulodinium_polyedra.AAC.1
MGLVREAGRAAAAPHNWVQRHRRIRDDYRSGVLPRGHGVGFACDGGEHALRSQPVTAPAAWVATATS